MRKFANLPLRAIAAAQFEEVQKLADVHRDNDLALSRIRKDVTCIFSRNSSFEHGLICSKNRIDGFVEHRIGMFVFCHGFRLHDAYPIGELHVALGLLVEAGDAVAHQLVGERAGNAVDGEGVAGVLEGGEVPRAHDGGEHALHALRRHGLHQLARAHRRVAQPCRRGDGALGVGRVVQKLYLHSISSCCSSPPVESIAKRMNRFPRSIMAERPTTRLGGPMHDEFTPLLTTTDWNEEWKELQKVRRHADDAAFWDKRSATFTKIAKEIIVAVKQGGSGDPANNSRLATVVAKAKAANMPNDNIKRTIDKALGSGNTDNYESVTYEGYGPCGVAVIVEALTDNRQRTAPEIRHYFDKYGKGMGAQGCVSWSFDRKGVIVIDNEDGELDEDTVMMDALDAGAEDFSPDGPVFEITTDPDSFNDVVKALEDKGYTFESAEIEMVPQNYVTMTGEDDVKSMNKLIDMLEDNEDVQNVWHNWQQD